MHAEPAASGLSPQAARVFLGAADAWHPIRDDADRPGASRVDVLAGLPAVLRPGESSGLERTLWVIEWLPRLELRRSGFCWLSRHKRRVWLRRLEGSPLPPLRRRALRLREIVDECYAAALAREERGEGSGAEPAQASSPSE